MIEFKTLTFRNFLSYGNNTTLFQLQRPGTSLIVGENLDNTAEGKGSNGVGKSAIINALTYAVYDLPVSDLAKDDLVNNINKKNMEVVVEFVIRKKTYRIQRTRKAKAGAAGNTVYVFEDGKDITPDSANAANALIAKIIGMPYELFVRIVVFSASHLPFLNLKTTEQTAIIEELFGLTALSQKALTLKELIKDTEKRIDVQRAKISAQEQEQTRHAQQVAGLHRHLLTWATQNKDTIKGLKAKLKRVESVNFDEQRALQQNLKDVNDQLNATLNTQRELTAHIRTITTNLKDTQHEIIHLRGETCPRCKQHFAAGLDQVDTYEKKATGLEDQMLAFADQKKLVDEQVVNFTHAIKDVKKQITVDNLDELLLIRQESANIRTKIEQLEQTPNPHHKPLEELQAVVFERIDYADVNEATKLLEHQQFLLKLLTKKDSFVRKTLLNKNIPFLNARLQHYLTTLGLPHKVEFTHEMSAKITQFGRDLTFGGLSNGQQARVNFGLALAFKDVLQNLHEKVNVCMLDEVLDHGLDTIGVQASARLLKRKARDEGLSLYIISHRDEIDRAFDHTLTVQFSKGFSYIVEEV